MKLIKIRGRGVLVLNVPVCVCLGVEDCQLFSLYAAIFLCLKSLLPVLVVCKLSF